MFKFYFSAVTYGIAFLIIGVYLTIVFVFHRSSMIFNCIRKLVFMAISYSCWTCFSIASLFI